MVHVIHQFISPAIAKIFSTNQIYGSLSKESYQIALKVAVGAALVFVLYRARHLYRHFSSNSVFPPPPIIPTKDVSSSEQGATPAETVPAAPLSSASPEEEDAFFTPSSEIGEQAVTEKEQQQLATKLQEVLIEQQPLSPLEKLKQMLAPFSYPCELPRQSGNRTVSFIDYFLELNNIKNCTLDASGRFTLTYDSKKEFQIRHLPDFAIKNIPVQLQNFLKGLVSRFSPKVQISNSLSGQVIQQGTSLEMTFDKGAIVVPEVASYPSNYKAEVKSIKFTLSSKPDEPSTVLFIDVEHNSNTVKLLGVTGKNLKAHPEKLIQVLDMNLFPHEYKV